MGQRADNDVYGRERQVSVDTNLSGSKEKTVWFPGVASIGRTGIQQAVDSVIDAQKPLWQEMAERQGRDLAEATPVVVDPATGQYRKADAPVGAGLVQREAFEAAARQRFDDQISADWETAANRAAGANATDLEAQQQALAQVRETFMARLPEGERNRLGPAIDRDYSGRQLAIVGAIADRQLKLTVDGLQMAIERDSTNAFTAAQAGDEEAAVRLYGAVHERTRNLIDLHVLPPEALDRVDEQSGAFLEGARFVRQVGAKRSAADYDDMHGVLTGSMERGGGITFADVASRITTPEARAHVAQRLAELGNLASRREAQAKEAEAARERAWPYQFWQSTGIRPPGFSDGELSQALFRDMVRQGVDPYTPQAAQVLFEQTRGQVPAGFYSGAFDGSAGKTPQELEGRLPLFRQLGNLTRRDGTQADMRHTLGDEDYAVFRAYSAAREMGASPEEAHRQALAGIKGARERTAEKADQTVVLEAAQDQGVRGSGTLGMGRVQRFKDLYETFDDGLEVWNFTDLSPRAQAAFTADVAGQVRANVPVKEAIQRTQARFRQSWTQDPGHLESWSEGAAGRGGAWVPVNEATPEVFDPGTGRASRAWAGPWVEQEITARGGQLPEHVRAQRPDRFEYGRNVRLQPLKNGTAMALYTGKDGAVFLIEGPDGLPLELPVNEAAAELDKKNRAAAIERASQTRRPYQAPNLDVLSAGP